MTAPAGALSVICYIVICYIKLSSNAMNQYPKNAIQIIVNPMPTPDNSGPKISPMILWATDTGACSAVADKVSLRFMSATIFGYLSNDDRPRNCARSVVRKDCGLMALFPKLDALIRVMAMMALLAMREQTYHAETGRE
jgi:hypothetical protein